MKIMSDDPAPLQQDPAIYLTGETTPSVRALAKQLGAVSAEMLAAIAIRLHHAADWMARWDGREKFALRAGAALAALALGNIGVVVKSWLNAHDTRIVAEAEARAAERAEIEYRKGVGERFERMERNILQLQEKLMRMSGLQPDAGGPGAPDMPATQRPPDAVSTTPASGSTSSGMVALHVPKLQNRQLGTSDVHSTLLLHVRPHEPLGAGDGVCLPQPMQMRNKTTLTMDALYPWLHSSSKGIVP